MNAPRRLGIQHFFADLPGPRIDRARRHQLLDIITIAVGAAIAGADTVVDIEQYGHARHAWFAAFLDLPGGLPAHDTGGRVFARRDPVAFEACFLSWVQAMLPQPAGAAIAIDGTVARRSHDRGAARAPIDLVSAWATDLHRILGQIAVDAHSNELPAVPALLALLDVYGAAWRLSTWSRRMPVMAASRPGSTGPRRMRTCSPTSTRAATPGRIWAASRWSSGSAPPATRPAARRATT